MSADLMLESEIVTLCGKDTTKEFVHLDLPSSVDLSRPTVFYAYRDGEYYVNRHVFGPASAPIEMQYKFGEPTNTTINGLNVEVEVTWHVFIFVFWALAYELLT